MNIYENSIIQAVDMQIEKHVSKLEFSYFLEGLITELNEDGTFQVRINNEIYNLKSIDDKMFEVGDIVDVCVKNNDFSRKFIAWKRVV